MMEMALVVAMLNSPLTDPETELEHHCLIENAIYEAVGEGVKGMKLVTEVVMNRYESEYRSNRTYCGTIYHRLQFSWTRLPRESLRKYTRNEYLKAAQVVFSLMYGETERVLPRNVRHYLNKKESTDQTWYRPEAVVYEWKNHEFLIVN